MGETTQFDIWKSPYTFVDKADLKGKKGAAYAFFVDMLVNRPTEFAALIRLFVAAYNLYAAEIALELTKKQQEAIRLALEALANGEHPTRYVAENLDISRQAAHQLLRRAEKRAKTFTSAELLTIHSRDNMQSPLNDAAIRAWMYSNKRECAGSGRPATYVDGRPVGACAGHTMHNHSLCWTCMQVYGKNCGDWEKWVEFKVRDITREHRQNAIEALYRERKLALPEDGEYAELEAVV